MPVEVQRRKVKYVTKVMKDKGGVLRMRGEAFPERFPARSNLRSPENCPSTKKRLRSGVDVFFITGRSESQRDSTAASLKSTGYDQWAGLALRGTHPKEQSVTEYKSGERKKIVDAGYGDRLQRSSHPASCLSRLPRPAPL